MSVFAGPDIVESGLVLALDAANPKSYVNIPGITDHGISDWYCFDSGTVTYSAIYPNTQIIEIDSNNNETVMVTTGSDPQRGTFSITAGRRYYGTKAIHLMIEDNQYAISPASFAGIYFAHYWGRNSPMTYYAYAPQDDTQLQFFDNNAANGVTGTVTATYNISRGSSTSFQSTAQSTWQFFKANKPIIMTAGATSSTPSSSDRTVLSPASQYVYKRRNNNNITINNTAPSTSSTYVTYDTSLPVMTVEIGDGAGLDACQGIGYEYLSDTFSWGNVLSDYQIVAPYADTTVTVSYWANNQWNVGEVHSLSGTQTNPDAAFREGNTGFGSPGDPAYDDGQALDLANGANLWKWESTKPIALIINDSADDEENMLGWMSNNYIRTSSNVDQSLVNLVDREITSQMTVYGKNLTTDSNYAGAKLSASQYIEFDGVDDYIACSGSLTLTAATFIAWMKRNGNQDTYDGILFSRGTNVTGTNFYTNNQLGYTWNDAVNTYTWNSELTIPDLTWCMCAVSVSSSSATAYLCQSSGITSATNNVSHTSTILNDIKIARDTASTRYYTGNIGIAQIYNRALTAQEIEQNFNAIKSRYF